MKKAGLALFLLILCLSGTNYAQDLIQSETLHSLKSSGAYIAGPARHLYPASTLQVPSISNSLDELWEPAGESFNLDWLGSGFYGVCWVEDAFYVTRWNYHYLTSPRENFTALNFEIDFFGIFELDYDGEYLYCATSDRTLYCVNPGNGHRVQENDIYVPVRESAPMTDMKTVSYDQFTDTFWAGNSQYVMNFDRAGNVLYHGAVEDADFWDSLFPMYGLAIDHTQAGQFLYVSHCSDNSMTQILKLDVNNNFEIIDSFDASSLLNGDYVAGGLDISSGWSEQYKTLMFLPQGAEQSIMMLELEKYAEDEAPAKADNFSVNPDLTGQLSAVVIWTNPETQVNGEQLSDLQEVRIYRDGELLHTVENAEPGDNQSFTDVEFTQSGTHNYTVRAVNPAGEGLPVSLTRRIGEDVPGKVTNLQITQEDPDIQSVQLAWTNPVLGLYGGALNNPISSYNIIRSDGESFEVTGIQTSFVDDTVPSFGYYSYSIQAINNIGSGGIALSEEILVSGPEFLLHEQFEGDVFDRWEASGDSIDSWMISNNTYYAGSFAPELVLDCGANNFDGITRIETGFLDTRGMNSLELMFNYNVSHWVEGYTLGVAVSNGGMNWTPVWEIQPTGNINGHRETVTIEHEDIGSPTFKISFYFEGYSYLINEWYIDDVLLVGEINPPGVPDNVTSVEIVPDELGNNYAQLTWCEPAQDIHGNNLAELLETKVYRNDILIHTNENPEMGNFSSFTDTIDSPEMVTYKIIPENSFGIGDEYETEIWVGEDTPAAVNEVLLNEINGDARITWNAPAEGEHGGVFNLGVEGYHIIRSDGAHFIAAPPNEVYYDHYLPGHNYYHYTVIPFNSVGEGSTAKTDSLLFGSSDIVFNEDCDAGFNSWERFNYLGENFYAFWNSVNSNEYWLGGQSQNSAFAVSATSHGPHDCALILDQAIDMSDVLYANVQFDCDYRGRYPDDQGIIAVSTDDGENWTNVSIWRNRLVQNQRVLVDITEHAAGQPEVLIKFHFRTSSFEAWWAVDNITINTSNIEAQGPMASLSINELEFPVTEVGQTSQLPLTINNVGSTMLRIVDIDFENNDVFSFEIVDPEDLFIPVDESLEVNIVFSPLDSIDYTDVLRVVSNAVPVEASITGQGHITSAVNSDESEIPDAYEVQALYPNPFNPKLTVDVALPQESRLTINAYDILGREVGQLVNSKVQAGVHSYVFDGQNLATGIYFIRASVPGKMDEIHKAVLVK